MDEKALRALIADAADAVAAAEFTEPQLEARAAAWQAAAPAADLAQTTAYIINENRAFTEALLAAVITSLQTKEHTY